VGNGTNKAAKGPVSPQQQDYAQQLLFDLSLDLDPLVAWSGAKVLVYALQVDASSCASVSIQPDSFKEQVVRTAGGLNARGGIGVYPSVESGLSTPSLGAPFRCVQEQKAWSLGNTNKPGSAAIGPWGQAAALSRCD
jgi:hypothetical protein